MRLVGEGDWDVSCRDVGGLLATLLRGLLGHQVLLVVAVVAEETFSDPPFPADNYDAHAQREEGGDSECHAQQKVFGNGFHGDVGLQDTDAVGLGGVEAQWGRVDSCRGAYAVLFLGKGMGFYAH